MPKKTKSQKKAQELRVDEIGFALVSAYFFAKISNKHDVALDKEFLSRKSNRDDVFYLVKQNEEFNIFKTYFPDDVLTENFFSELKEFAESGARCDGVVMKKPETVDLEHLVVALNVAVQYDETLVFLLDLSSAYEPLRMLYRSRQMQKWACNFYGGTHSDCRNFADLVGDIEKIIAENVAYEMMFGMVNMAGSVGIALDEYYLRRPFSRLEGIYQHEVLEEEFFRAEENCRKFLTLAEKVRVYRAFGDIFSFFIHNEPKIFDVHCAANDETDEERFIFFSMAGAKVDKVTVKEFNTENFNLAVTRIQEYLKERGNSDTVVSFENLIKEIRAKYHLAET